MTYAPTALWPCRFECDVSTYSPTVTGLAARYASDTLWALSGRQFGLTTVTLRPCRDVRYDTPFPDSWLSWPGTQRPPLGATSSGGWWGFIPVICGSCTSGCSCTTLSQVKLPAPVYSITEVKIDGNVLSPLAYRVDEARFLTRIDGGLWPLQNTIGLPDTSVGTWAVTAQYGQPVPAGAEVAVGELACEFIRALSGEDCRLPRSVTMLARQGVTIQMPSPETVFGKGLTGLYLADMFIRTWNPNALKTRSRVYGVDTPLARRVTT